MKYKKSGIVSSSKSFLKLTPDSCLSQMPDDQNYDRNNKHENRNPVDTVHHFQVNITFGIRLPFTEYIYI